MMMLNVLMTTLGFILLILLALVGTLIIDTIFWSDKDFFGKGRK